MLNSRPELQSHLEMAVRDRIAAGADPEAARAGARREFGNLGQVREATRSMWRFSWAERARKDFRYALRALVRSPGLAIVGIVTLALGIGANTAIFTVVHGVLLKPLPYPHPERLIYITSQLPALGFDQFPVDGAEFLEFRERNHSFQDVGAFAVRAANVGTGEHLARVTSAFTSASLFATLGVPMAAGRNFSPEEDARRTARWRQSFRGNSGRHRSGVHRSSARRSTSKWSVAHGGGSPATRFRRPRSGRSHLAPCAARSGKRVRQYRGSHGYYLIGRLKPGVTIAKARAELEVMLSQWLVLDGGTLNSTTNTVHAPNAVAHRIRFDDLLSDMVGTAGRALWVLQAAVALVLLIACANLANLLLMRAESRRRELGVRLALGASRGDLVRQFLVEGLVLSVSGAVAGVVLAGIGLRALTATYAGSIPRAGSVSIDVPVLAFTVAIAVATGIVFGLAPLLQLDAHGGANMLRDGGARSTGGIARRGIQRGLVIAEIAMAVMLVVGAGLLVRSLWNLLRVDAGFQREQLSTFQVTLPPVPYADSMRRVAFYDKVTRQLGAVPGIKSVAAMSGLPPLRPVNANDTQFEGFTPVPGGPQANVDYWQFVTPGYISTMGIPVISGRDFRESDGVGAPPVVLINQTIARLYYPGQDPIGRRIKPGGANDWFTIVGVVKDVKQSGVDSRTGTELYIGYPQSPATLGFAPGTMNIVIRSSLPPGALSPPIHRSRERTRSRHCRSTSYAPWMM